MNIEKYAETTSSVMLTGDRPTGRLHLGHYVGSIKQRLNIQQGVDEAYYMVADIQALTDHQDHPEIVAKNVREVVLDNLSTGVDPQWVNFFIQSQVPEIAELTVLFLNLVTVARLKRNPTVKDEMIQKGYGEAVPAGFLVYPVSQAADILFCKATQIPVGEDQLPMIELANEIASRFNATYGVVFPKVEAVVGETGRLVGIDGHAKASKSLGNAIYLSDSPEEIEAKVMDMYTDPSHARVEDPGTVEGNVVFTYLDVFDTRTQEVEALKVQYRAGGLGDVALKKRLVEVLRTILDPIREKRKEFENDPAYVDEIIRAGTERAREVARKTMAEVRTAMGITY